MKWLLVLTLSYPGTEPGHVPVGIMIDQPTCVVAGGSMAEALMRANPGLQVAWTCLPEQPEAGA